jgi:hypothetical protein
LSSEQLATVIDEDEWTGRVEMREALDDIAKRYGLGKYEKGKRVVRRKPAPVIDMADYRARKAAEP